MNDEQSLPTTDGVDNKEPSSTTGNGDDQDFSALQNELKDTKSKLSELTLISQHALADLQNYKKRTEEEKIKFVAFANSGLIADLLPILDNIERATTHLPEDPAAKEWANGLLIIFNKLRETLHAHGLESLPTENLPFDPNLHEAVMTENGPQDQIRKELEKGYRLGDRVLRRSKVSVGNGQPATENAATPSSTQ